MWYYRILVWLLLPLVLLRLGWRGWRERGYWQHVPERLGWYPTAPDKVPRIWLHAVSVGETRAAVPLVAGLQAQYPQYRLLLTHGTPSGRDMGRHLFGGTVDQCYLPYDTAWAVRRFVRHYHPAVGVMMETELWPNLVLACWRARVPLILANARMSERSASRYRRFLSLTQTMLTRLCRVAAQSDEDAHRLRELGAQRVTVMGNLKFDQQPSQQLLDLAGRWRAGLAPGRLVCVAASTRAQEEALILDVWQRVAPRDALLVLVPRHPQRFGAVAQLLEQRGLVSVRRSSGLLPTVTTQVWLGDSMGEMSAWFALADVAIIGGSLLPFGGQNLIEATAVGCPVIVGPHMWNFAQATRAAVDRGAALALTDVQELADVLLSLLTDEKARQRMHDAGLKFSQDHRGATGRLLPLVAECLAQNAAHGG